MKAEIIEIINTLNSDAVLMFLKALLQEIAKDEEGYAEALGATGETVEHVKR